MTCYLDQSVDAVQLLDLVPGALLASDLAQGGHVVTLEAVHELEMIKVYLFTQSGR
jgi:hypothetical protein